jgi:SAM-dependent methyltransferase
MTVNTTSSIEAAEAVPDEVTLEEVACPMGCGAPSPVVARGWDRLHRISGRFTVVRCGSCGLMRTAPRPTQETIGVYYPGAYAPHVAGPPDRAAGALERLRMALRFDGTRKLLPPIPPGLALEVGCAAGRFMRKMRRRGWTVHGIEPSPQAAAEATAHGFQVHAGPLETAPTPATPYDLVVASHSFEHLHAPLDGFQRLRAWSRPGASLVAAVPDASGLLFGRFRGAWYDLDLPRHLFHYTPATLTAILAKAGWKVERVRPEATLNGLAGSLGYFLRDRNHGNSAIGDALLRFPAKGFPLKALTWPLELLLTAFRQTGRMVAWARAI